MVFKDASCTEVDEAVSDSIFLNPLGCYPAYPFIGSNPDIAVAGFEKCADEVIRQFFWRRVMHGAFGCDAVGAASIRANPQISLTSAKDISHHHVGQLGKVERKRDTTVNPIHAGSNDPQVAVSIAGNRCEVGIGTTGQWNHA